MRAHSTEDHRPIPFKPFSKERALHWSPEKRPKSRHEKREPYPLTAQLNSVPSMYCLNPATKTTYPISALSSVIEATIGASSARSVRERQPALRLPGREERDHIHAPVQKPYKTAKAMMAGAALIPSMPNRSAATPRQAGVKTLNGPTASAKNPQTARPTIEDAFDMAC